MCKQAWSSFLMARRGRHKWDHQLSPCNVCLARKNLLSTIVLFSESLSQTKIITGARLLLFQFRPSVRYVLTLCRSSYHSAFQYYRWHIVGFFQVISNPISSAPKLPFFGKYAFENFPLIGASVSIKKHVLGIIWQAQLFSPLIVFECSKDSHWMQLALWLSQSKI